MKKKTLSSQILKISLHGMDNKMQKMMVTYLELNCKRIALVVEDSGSQAEIIDIDLANSKSLLEERLVQQPPKPIIVLSLNEVSNENVIFVKKPIDKPCVIEALKKVRKSLQKRKRVASLKDKSDVVSSISDTETAKFSESNTAEIDDTLDHEILLTDSKKITRTENPIDSFIPDSDELNEKGGIEAEIVDVSIQTPEPDDLKAPATLTVPAPIQDSIVLSESKVESENFPEILKKEQIDDISDSIIEVTNDKAHLSYDENISLLVAENFIKEDDFLNSTTESISQTDDAQAITNGQCPAQLLEKEFFAKQLDSIEKNVENSLKVEDVSESKKTELASWGEKDRRSGGDRRSGSKKDRTGGSKEDRRSGSKEDRRNGKDRRKEIRYEFDPFEAKLNKNLLPGLRSDFRIMVGNLSSRGALIELEKANKLSGKVTLFIEFDNEHIYAIQSIIVRRVGKKLYGLQFLEAQHEILSYLVDSGRNYVY